MGGRRGRAASPCCCLRGLRLLEAPGSRYLGSRYPKGEAFGGERRASINSSSLNPSALVRCFRAAGGLPPESWFQLRFRSILILPPSTPLRCFALVTLKLFIRVLVRVLSAWSCVSAPLLRLFAMPLSLRVPGRAYSCESRFKSKPKAGAQREGKEPGVLVANYSPCPQLAVVG